MKRTRKKILEEVRKTAPRNEEITVNLLAEKGFKIDYWHGGKPSNKPYDIIARKGRERWAIEVKSGRRPHIVLKNIKDLIYSGKYDRIGLALIVDGRAYLLEHKIRATRGEDAWARKRKQSKWWSKKHRIRAKRNKSI